MKLRNAIKLVVAGALIAPASAMAMEAMGSEFGMFAGATTGDPTGAWTVDSAGVINASCPAGYTCSAAAIAEGGIVQQMVEDAEGNKFVRTIVAETGESTATGFNDAAAGSVDFFGDESWVALGSTKGGLSGKSMITDNTTADKFNAGGTINTGTFMPMLMEAEVNMAVTAGGYGGDMQAAMRDHGAMIEFNQSITNAAKGSSDTFDFMHGMYMGMEGTSSFTGKYATVDINSTIDETVTGTPGNDYNGFKTEFNFSETDWEDLTISDTSMANLAAEGVNNGMKMTIQGTVASAGAAGDQNDDFAQDFMHLMAMGSLYDGDTITDTSTNNIVVGGGMSIEAVMIDQYVGQGGTFSLADATDGTNVIEADSFIGDTFEGVDGSIALTGSGTGIETGSVTVSAGIAGLFNDYDSGWAYAYDDTANTFISSNP